MKRNNIKMRNKRDLISKMIVILLVSFAIFSLSTIKNSLVVEGSYILEENGSILLADSENGSVLHIYDDIAYVLIQNATQIVADTSSVCLINIQQPENPMRLGKYELEAHERIPKMEVNESIAYLLREQSHSGNSNWTITLLNINNLEVPTLIGETPLENKTTPTDFTLNNDYLYVSTNSTFEIFDCSSPATPVKVANYSLPSGYLHINNDLLFIVSDYVRIYDLTNPINPIFQGEIISTKHTLAGSGLYKNYLISAFWWFGLQVYNCTKPNTPTIIGNYEFPDKETEPGGQIHDMEIVGDKLFAGGRKLYVFDISNPQKLRRIAVEEIGERDTYGISVSGNYIFANIHHNIKVYSIFENFLGRNLGLGLGIGTGISFVVVGSLIFLKKKEKLIA